MLAHQLSEHLQSLIDAGNWSAAMGMRGAIEAFNGTPKERAELLHTLGSVYWDHAATPFDCVCAIQCAHRANEIDALDGKPLKSLGTRLILVGCTRKGVQVLSEWLRRRHEWHTTNRSLGEVRYMMGSAAQREADYPEAETCYSAALDSFALAGKPDLMYRTACALAQVKIRMGLLNEARQVLDSIPIGTIHEGHRLRSLVEILHAEGDTELTMKTGEEAAEALLAGDAYWEAAELFLFLAALYEQVGDFAERDKHLEAAEMAVVASPQHRLYTPARTLLSLP